MGSNIKIIANIATCNPLTLSNQASSGKEMLKEYCKNLLPKNRKGITNHIREEVVSFFAFTVAEFIWYVFYSGAERYAATALPREKTKLRNLDTN
jgi:hypothetical protein